MARDLTRTKPDLNAEHPGGVDEFAGRSRVTKGEGDSPVSSGWSVDKRPRVSRSGDRPNKFNVPDGGEEILIKFLNETPFASFYQHWVATKEGRRAYVCLGKSCPLCDNGDIPKASDWFNVIEMSETPVLSLWYASPDPATAIKERADSKRTAPINKQGLYFAVSKRAGKNGFNSYTVDPVKEEELEDDWGVVPLTEDQIKEFEAKAYGPDLVKVPSKNELQAIVDEYFKD